MLSDAFKSIWKNKLRSVLFLILTALTYFLVLTSLTDCFSFYTQLSDARGFFRDARDTYRVDAVHIENEDSIGKDFEELKAFVNGCEDSVCGAYDIVGEYFDELMGNSEIIEMNKKFYAGSKSERFPEIIETVFIDIPILEILNFDLTDSEFKPVEIDGTVYSALYAGSDFEGILSVGDKLTLSGAGEKYIVMGFMEDKKWLDDNDPITMPQMSLNHMFLAPFSELEKQLSLNDFNMIHHATVGKIFMKCPAGTASEFNSRASEKGIKFRVTSIYDFTEDWKLKNEGILQMRFFLAAIVLICSAVSIVSILCVSILMRKREYGVRIAFGGTKKRIIISACIEMLILNLISASGAFALSYRSFAGNIIQSYRDIYLRTLCTMSLYILVILIIVFMAVTLTIPLNLLRRYNPAELIKEED